MDTCQINVSEIWINILKNKFSLSYAKIAKKLGCAVQTLTDWRTGLRTPREASIDDICKLIPDILKKETDKQDFISYLKEEFSEHGSKVKVSMEQCDSIEQLLKYLYHSLQKDMGEDKLFELLNSSESNTLLRDIVIRKFKENERRTPFFQVEEVGEEVKKELENKNINWKLDLEHCFILKFKESEKKYNYKVLINFNFNEREYKQTGHLVEARDAVKSYGVKTILLFSNAPITKEEMCFFIDSNIYVEQIDLSEIEKKELSKDYVYSTENEDIRMESLANKYSDIILGRLGKYYSVFYKNILFNSEKILTGKQKESYIFWEAKFAVRHHINFEENIINDFLNEGQIKRGGNALAIGYLSFPCVLRLVKYFEKIYLMDNSNISIKMYEQYISSIDANLLKRIEFITFTSAVSDAVTEKYRMYNAFDFILIGTGSGSFIKKIQVYYLLCNLWLKKGGTLYISFLNKDFLYEYINKASAEHNFEFVPWENEKRATAMFLNNSEKFELYCETYSCNEIKDVAEKYFKLARMYSYPLVSVLEGAYESKLQNILKEIDKTYSKEGFSSKTFSNSRGYYIDAVLQKCNEQKVMIDKPEGNGIEEIQWDERKHKHSYLKVLLLEDMSQSKYVILLPAQKKLQETSTGEVYLGGKRFQMLDIAEINALGIEHKNISPFLKECDEQIKLKKYYADELDNEEKSFYYVGSGEFDKNLKIEKKVLLKLLKEFGYKKIQI